MTTRSSTMSSAELLLATALRLTTDGRAISAEELIVEAWKANSEKFGMKEYPYPDTHKILSVLCGAKGLVGSGKLSRVDGRYSLTDKGRGEAVRLTGESAPVNGKPVPSPVKEKRPRRLPAKHDALLRQLFTVKRRNRPMGEWTVREACEWWRLLGDDYTPDQVDWIARQLAEVSSLLAGQRCVLSDGRETTAEEVAELIELDSALRKRFASHLKALANRNGDSK